MCTGLFGGSPDTVNSRGDKLSGKDLAQLNGDLAPPGSTGRVVMDMISGGAKPLKLTAQQRGEMLYNWLTAGGAPKPLDPSKIFGEKQAVAGVQAKASAGTGIGGLFGAGLLVGDLTPKMEGLAPAETKTEGLKPLEPINQSPMQLGVPYSTTPLVKLGGR